MYGRQRKEQEIETEVGARTVSQNQIHNVLHQNTTIAGGKSSANLLLASAVQFEGAKNGARLADAEPA